MITPGSIKVLGQLGGSYCRNLGGSTETKLDPEGAFKACAALLQEGKRSGDQRRKRDNGSDGDRQRPAVTFVRPMDHGGQHPETDDHNQKNAGGYRDITPVDRKWQHGQFPPWCNSAMTKH
jgi:hypothetical protein